MCFSASNPRSILSLSLSVCLSLFPFFLLFVNGTKLGTTARPQKNRNNNNKYANRPVSDIAATTAVAAAAAAAHAGYVSRYDNCPIWII